MIRYNDLERGFKMQMLTSGQGIYFVGKISELQALLQEAALTHTTVADWIKSRLH
jgi:hypothetical protein